MSQPAISVVLSVYNGEAYLREAIDSILNQTFSDFELIIINDGSTDDTLEILASYGDSRIRIESQANSGLQRALNRGIALSQGKYIARMDDDDIALPERFEKQIAYLEENNEIGLLGTNCIFRDDASGREWTQPLPYQHDEIVSWYLKGSPFIHPTVMMKRSLLESVGGYDERYTFGEDYALWITLGQHTRMANLPEPLLIHREHADSLTLKQQPTLRASMSLIWLGIHNRFRAFRIYDYPLSGIRYVFLPILHGFVELNPKTATQIKRLFKIKTQKRFVE